MGQLTALLGVALAFAVGTASAAPARVVSLNLCTDELALLLASPGQLVSVSFLGADPEETRLASRAKGLHRNNGRMESVAALAPDLVLTGGGVNRYAAEMARRLGVRVVDAPPPLTLDELRRNIRRIASALGRASSGEAMIARMDAQLGRPPRVFRSAVLLSGGGYTVGPNSLAASLLRYAGLVQQAYPTDRVGLERLLSNPPEVIVLTHYRAYQTSNHQLWLAHPALKRLPPGTRKLSVDGRAWTCLSPLVATDIERLRRLTQ